MQDETIAMIAAERAALLEFLQRASGDAWDRPTPCADWTVKEVLAHMVEGELNVGRVYRGELTESGYIDPEEGIAKWRALPGEAVRAALWQHGVAAQRVLDGMTEDVWRRSIKVFGCREVRQLVRLHLFDLAVHGHDLTDALGGEPVWGPRLDFLAEFVVRAAPLTMRRRGVAPEGALEVRTPARRWTLDGRGERWELTETAGAGASVRMNAEDLVLATTGRLDVREALARAEIGGDAGTAERILGAWQVLAS
jgi:uncharacterized protein (TIGR03083 family)